MNILPKQHGHGIVDAHLHLDDRDGASAEQAAQRLVDEMAGCGVSHAIVLHLAFQRWSMEDVAQALASRPMLTGFVNIDPQASDALATIDRAAALGFRGLKLHPRLQKYRPDDAACIALVRRAGERGWPVVIDCFPDGHWLLDGLDVRQYGRLAQQAPEARVVVAHAAGHHCLDLLMIAKRVPNLWMDLSYSLLYYDGPVVDNLFYAMRSIRHERVNFGTDYPDRALAVSVQRSLALFDRHGLTGEARDKILCKNALQLLQATSA
jgi:uncharacterized protein